MRSSCRSFKATFEDGLGKERRTGRGQTQKNRVPHRFADRAFEQFPGKSEPKRKLVQLKVLGGVEIEKVGFKRYRRQAIERIGVVRDV